MFFRVFSLFCFCIFLSVIFVIFFCFQYAWLEFLAFDDDHDDHDDVYLLWFKRRSAEEGIALITVLITCLINNISLFSQIVLFLPLAVYLFQQVQGKKKKKKKITKQLHQ